MKAKGGKGASPVRRMENRAGASPAMASPDLAGLSVQEARRLVHELRVHQVELETQNEELRRTQTELELSRDRFNHLYDSAPVGYVTIDMEGTISQANLTMTRMLGVERGRLVGMKLSRYITKESQDHLYLHLWAAREGRASPRSELELRRADASTFSAQLESACGRDLISQDILCHIAVVDITERKQAEEKLKVSLREKEVLLREIHHRVKNNLQVISSLVSLQAETLAKEPGMQALFSDIRDRVRAMALVHERLYESQDLARLDFTAYLRSLLNYLFRAYADVSAKVRLSLAVEPVALPLGIAMHCGLILNELVSNALKHAFPYGGGEIIVSLDRDAVTDAVCLRVRDNGIGLPEGLDWRHTRSLGLRLVQMLAKQLRGTVEASRESGTEFSVRFVVSGTTLAM